MIQISSSHFRRLLYPNLCITDKFREVDRSLEVSVSFTIPYVLPIIECCIILS